MLLALAFVTAPSIAQQRPLTKTQVDDLVAGGLDSQQIAKAVRERGLDFQATDEYLSTLRTKGATQALIDALRATTPTPLGKTAIVHLLAAGTSDEAITDMVKRRGLAFTASDQDLDTLRIAGAGPLLLKAVREPAFVLPSIASPTRQSDAPATPGGTYDVGGNVTAPIPIYSPDPGYSEEAREAKYSGMAVVVAIVDAQGDVVDAQILKRVGLGLDEKAIETVRQWKFKPALRNGTPVKVRVNIEVTFRLLAGPSGDATAVPNTSNQGQWKSRAEYDGFQRILANKDPHAMITAADAFLQKYSSSDFRDQADLVRMQAYQQLNEPDKAIDAARDALKANPDNLGALNYVCFAEPFLFKPSDPNRDAELSELDDSAKRGLDVLGRKQRPVNMSDEDFSRQMEQLRANFNNALGFVASHKKNAANDTGTLYIKAVAYRAIPYETTAYLQTSGHSNTSCYGSGSVYGYMSTLSLNCQTVVTPPTVIPVTIRRVDVYNQIEAGGMTYTLKCSAHWVGSGCSWLLPGETFQAEVKGTTMWVSGRKGGNMGKSVRPKFRILDIRPTQ